MKTKKQRIKEHLEMGNSITQRDAYELFNHTRLAAVVHELKSEGMNISSTEKSHVNSDAQTIRYSEYKMIGAPGNKDQISMFSSDLKNSNWADAPPKFDEKKHIR